MVARVAEPRAALLRFALTTLAVAGPAACAGAPAPLPEPLGPPKEQLAGQLESTYARWNEHDVHQHCSVYLATCADTFARRAGFDPSRLGEPNPRALIENPDPEWIPGWSELPTADEQRHVVFEALAYAGSHRAVREACEAEFNGVLARRADLSSRLAIDALGMANVKSVHERIGRVVALRSELRRGEPDPVGALYHAELMVWRTFEDAGLGYLWRAQEQRSSDIAQLRPALETSIELDLYCRSRHELAWQDQRAELARYVRPAMSKERLEAITSAERKARDLERRLPGSQPELLQRPDGALAPREGAYVAIDRTAFGAPLHVRSIETSKSGQSVVQLFGYVERADAPLGCKPTDRIEKVEPDGEVRYAEDCKRGPVREEISVRVSMLELPSNPAPAVGDQLVVAGTLSKSEVSTKRAGATQLERRTLEIGSGVVIEMWRDKMLLANFFFQ
jgi:hypothetical protein